MVQLCDTFLRSSKLPMWGRSYERPPVHTVTNSDDLVQQGQLYLIGFSTPNRRGGSCGGLNPNPKSPTKQGSKIGHSVRGDVLCVVSLVGRHSTCEVSACPHIMDEGSYMCHNCQGSGSLALGPSCSSMRYVAGLLTALCGGAPDGQTDGLTSPDGQTSPDESYES